MSWGGLGERVIVVGVAEPCAPAREPRQTARELLPEPIQIVASELIDRDQDNEGGRSRFDGIGSRWRLRRDANAAPEAEE